MLGGIVFQMSTDTCRTVVGCPNSRTFFFSVALTFFMLLAAEYFFRFLKDRPYRQVFATGSVATLSNRNREQWNTKHKLLSMALTFSTITLYIRSAEFSFYYGILLKPAQIDLPCHRTRRWLEWPRYLNPSVVQYVSLSMCHETCLLTDRCRYLRRCHGRAGHVRAEHLPPWPLALSRTGRGRARKRHVHGVGHQA